MFIEPPQKYGKAKRRGRTAKFSGSAQRHLLREDKKGEKSANQLCSDLKFPIGIKEVQQILKEISTFNFKKMKTATKLTG